MKLQRSNRLSLARVLLVAGLALSHTAQADFELTGPDGRRILLKDDGTWQHLEASGKARSDDKSRTAGEAVLTLERKMETGNGCRFVVQLVNNLPYEIRSLLPYYSVSRGNGVVYDTVSSNSGFTAVRPGDKQVRDFEFVGIACQEIARVQVVGGDRCVMGDLHKYTDEKGQCLARLRVVASDLVRFDK